VYRILVDCYVEKLALQTQVERAGGQHQRTYNPGDARKLLGIPAYWADNEPTGNNATTVAITDVVTTFEEEEEEED
jgi:hypothetical protein